MGGFLFGYDSSVINGAVQAIRSRYDIGSLFAALSLPFVLVFVKETKGKTLEQMG